MPIADVTSLIDVFVPVWADDKGEFFACKLTVDTKTDVKLRRMGMAYRTRNHAMTACQELSRSVMTLAPLKAHLRTVRRFKTKQAHGCC